LGRILSNSQLRGGWGERQVQQIFSSVGLLEKQHYFVQQILGSSAVRPDFTILLPGEKKLCLDAKFPLANLQLMAATEDKAEKQRFDKAFVSDVKDKVKEISGRGYISEEDGTCDYAVMFVPSEAVFDYINRFHPEVVDEAMNKKVLMASPYSLVAIIRTVSESYRNFYYESSMREIVKKVDVFLNDWRLFEDEFSKFGGNLKKTLDDYDKITNTRYRLMNTHIRQIQDARSGTKQLEGVEAPVPPILLEGEQAE
jgi:DNA recombination protein RmuC